MDLELNKVNKQNDINTIYNLQQVFDYDNITDGLASSGRAVEDHARDG